MDSLKFGGRRGYVCIKVELAIRISEGVDRLYRNLPQSVQCIALRS